MSMNSPERNVLSGSETQKAFDQVVKRIFLRKSGSPYNDRVLNSDAINGDALSYTDEEVSERRRRASERIKLFSNT